MKFLFFFLSCFLVGFSLQNVVIPKQQIKDEITIMPGFKGNIPFKQYSGYIDVDISNGRNLFYYFQESQNNPATDPIVVWLQGGPGCSSMIGAFIENGFFEPNVFSSDQTNDALKENPNSWNRIANMLYIDSPAGVGFSFSKTPSDYNTNNNKTAKDSLHFLENWFARFPQFQSNDFWITGESYAGDYIPQVVYDILHSSTQLTSQLKGIMIGNPVMNCPAVKQHANTLTIENYYWHGLIPLRMKNQWYSEKCEGTTENPPLVCSNIMKELNDITVLDDRGWDPDNLYSNLCTGNASLDLTKTTPNCLSVQQARNIYLNRNDVQSALGVVGVAPSDWQWESCRGPFSSPPLNYTTNNPSLTPFYDFFFSNSSFKILIYSGDVDIDTVPHPETQLCLESLKRRVTKEWRRWTVEGFTAGFVEVLDTYTFATVKGAGHEVPAYVPQSAFALFSRFLNGQDI